MYIMYMYKYYQLIVVNRFEWYVYKITLFFRGPSGFVPMPLLTFPCRHSIPVRRYCFKKTESCVQIRSVSLQLELFFLLTLELFSVGT